MRAEAGRERLGKELRGGRGWGERSLGRTFGPAAVVPIEERAAIVPIEERAVTETHLVRREATGSWAREWKVALEYGRFFRATCSSILKLYFFFGTVLFLDFSIKY
jgi:hypothetical protein